MPPTFPKAETRALVGELLTALAAKPPRIKAITWHQDEAKPETKRRAPVRRRGYSRAYTKGKWNDARRGTWRHYMLETMHTHANTRDADNALAELPADHKFYGHKLDWTWAEKSGYVIFN
jgi:hypothetical protein